jgi:hypothetical protein
MQGVPTMLRELFRLATDESKPEAVRLAAIRDWLDRAGINSKIEISLETNNWQNLVVDVFAEMPDEKVELPRYMREDPTAALPPGPHSDVVEGEVVEREGFEVPDPDEDGGVVYDYSTRKRVLPKGRYKDPDPPGPPDPRR